MKRVTCVALVLLVLCGLWGLVDAQAQKTKPVPQSFPTILFETITADWCYGCYLTHHEVANIAKFYSKHFGHLQIETHFVDVSKAVRFDGEEKPKVGDFRLRLNGSVFLHGQQTFGCSIKSMGDPPSKYIRQCLYLLGALTPQYISDCDSLKTFVQTDPWSSSVYYQILVDLSFDNMRHYLALDDQWDWIVAKQSNATFLSLLRGNILADAIHALEEASVMASYEDVEVGFIAHDSPFWDPNSCLPERRYFSIVDEMIRFEHPTTPAVPLEMWVSISDEKGLSEGVSFKKLDSMQDLKEEATRNKLPFVRTSSVSFKEALYASEKKMRILALLEHNEAGRIKYPEDYTLLKELSSSLGPDDEISANFDVLVLDGLHYYGLAERICQIDVDHEKYLHDLCGLPLFAAIDPETMFISSISSVDLFAVEEIVLTALDRYEILRSSSNSNSSLECNVFTSDENEVPVFPPIQLTQISASSGVSILEYSQFKLWYCAKVFSAEPTDEEEAWLIIPTVGWTGWSQTTRYLLLEYLEEYLEQRGLDIQEYLEDKGLVEGNVRARVIVVDCPYLCPELTTEFPSVFGFSTYHPPLYRLRIEQGSEPVSVKTLLQFMNDLILLDWTGEEAEEVF